MYVAFHASQDNKINQTDDSDHTEPGPVELHEPKKHILFNYFLFSFVI